jgi:hypothetical protein
MKQYLPFRLIFPKLPFNYPSSWLVFLHVMKWNRIGSFREIRKILEVDGSVRPALNRWWDGGQVPHWKVEDACGLKRNELKYSFLDGWFPIPKLWECATLLMRGRARIRHCPQCIKFGYHSAVFYFEHITHCPWHREALQYCENCTDVLLKTWYEKKALETVSEQCEHLGIVLDALPPAEVPETFLIEERDWCNKHRDWVQCAIRLIGHAVYEVLAAQPFSMQDKQLVLKFLADRLWPPDFSYKLDTQVSILKLPVSKRAWELPYRNLLYSPGLRVRQRRALRAAQPQANSYDDASITKSIRRYLFRRYLRPHRKCLARLAAAEIGRWHTFNLATVCPCVMAYLIVFAKYWGIPPSEFLHSKMSHMKSHAERFIRRDATLRCESDMSMYNLLGDFYKMWSVLRNFREIDCHTLLLSYRYESGHFSFVTPRIYESALHYRQYVYWDAYLFMEDQACTLTASISDCIRRRRQPLTVELDAFQDSALANNQNILCALHNPESNSGRCCLL